MPLPHSLTAVPRDWHVHQEIARAIQTLFAQMREQDDRQPLNAAAAMRERELLKLIARDIPGQFAPLLHAELRKTGYDPNEPRVPAGSPHGGEWTSDGIYAANEPPGIGHNQGPPLDEPPKIPPKPPGSVQALNDFLKTAARFLSKFPKNPRAAIFAAVLFATKWLSDRSIAYIKAYLDPPKTWEELQRDALNPQPGYDIHHPVEQTPARQDGFPESEIDGPENRLRIPTLKHWEINGWYGRKNPNYRDENGNIVSPREYLRGKSWEERLRVGREALIIHGVLRP